MPDIILMLLFCVLFLFSAAYLRDSDRPLLTLVLIVIFFYLFSFYARKVF